MTQEVRYICDICGLDIDNDQSSTEIEVSEHSPARQGISPGRYDRQEYHFHDDCARPLVAYIERRLSPERQRV